MYFENDHEPNMKGWRAAILERLSETLAPNHAPGADAPGTAAPQAWIIWENILSWLCSRSIIWMYTTPGAYLLHAPGALCIQICRSIFHWEYYSRLFLLLEQLFLEYNLGSKSHRSFHNPERLGISRPLTNWLIRCLQWLLPWRGSILWCSFLNLLT